MQKLSVIINNEPSLEKTQIVSFSGDFDGAAKDSIVELEKTVQSCNDGCTLIFDFAGLNYLNSFAIGQLVEWHNILNTKNGKILVVGANKNVEDIFSILGIASIFKIYPTLELAKESLA